MKVKLLVGIAQDGKYFGIGYGENEEHQSDIDRSLLESQCWDSIDPEVGNIEFFVVEAELPEIQVRTVKGSVSK